MSGAARTLLFYVAAWREAGSDDRDPSYCFTAAQSWAAFIISQGC